MNLINFDIIRNREYSRERRLAILIRLCDHDQLVNCAHVMNTQHDNDLKYLLKKEYIETYRENKTRMTSKTYIRITSKGFEFIARNKNELS